jgi:hypothetical protein
MSVLAIYPNQFNTNCINLLEPRPNSIIDGCFSKLLFGDELFLMHGLTICVPVCAKAIHIDHINAITNIELSLLSLYSNNVFTVSRIVETLTLRYSITNILAPQGLSENLLIKISGIWENKQGNIGLSFRYVTI